MADDLLVRSQVVTSLSDESEETYSWLSRTRLLYLRPRRDRGWLWNRAPFVLVTQFFHTYEAVVRDISTGQEIILEVFNRKYSSQFVAVPVHMRYLGADGKEDAPR